MFSLLFTEINNPYHTHTLPFRETYRLVASHKQPSEDRMCTGMGYGTLQPRYVSLLGIEPSVFQLWVDIATNFATLARVMGLSYGKQ